MKEINDEIKIEKFENFYQWLKEDGLVARRSERMLKKRIFRNLLGNEEMTMENFEDFLEDEETKKRKKEIFENNKFVGKRILTTNGTLIIESVFENQGGIQVIYTDGNHSIFENIESLEEAQQ